MGHESRYFDASDEAKTFVKSNITVDGLTAPISPGWPREEMFEEYHGRAHDAGIGVIGLSVSGGAHTFDDLLKQASRFYTHINADERFRIVHNTDDIKSAQTAGQQSLFFNCQGTEVLNNNPSLYMPVLRGLGVGTMALAYNERFRAGDGCLVEDQEAGKVTLYGKMVIDAIHANNIVLDLSHASERTALSAIEHSQKTEPDKPVMYTHSNPRRVYDFYRSISDEEARACAATGGVIGLALLPWFINDYLSQETKPEDIVRAIDITVELVGIDHVGLASDDTYSWPGLWENALAHPEWYQDKGETVEAAKSKPSGSAEPAKIFPAVVDLLWKKGYADQDIAKIFGGNLMRVYEQIWG